MISRSKQNWTVGSTVKAGFLSLVVRAALATPGDGLPDAYILSNPAGTKLYRFTPHLGLESLSIAEAAELIREGQRIAAQTASADLAKAQQDSRARAELDAIFSQVAA